MRLNIFHMFKRNLYYLFLWIIYTYPLPHFFKAIIVGFVNLTYKYEVQEEVQWKKPCLWTCASLGLNTSFAIYQICAIAQFLIGLLTLVLLICRSTLYIKESSPSSLVHVAIFSGLSFDFLIIFLWCSIFRLYSQVNQ